MAETPKELESERRASEALESERRASEALESGRRASDHYRELLLVEKENEIARLAKRVETLMTDRVTTQQLTQVTLQAQDQGRALVRFEHALFGVEGNNGLYGKVRDLYGGLDEMKRMFTSMREEEFKELKDQMAASHASFGRWSIALVTTILVVGGGIFGALIASGHI